MENDNWIKGILAFFIVVAFFGGYYVGAMDMTISFEIDDNTLKATEHMTGVLEFIEMERELNAWSVTEQLEITETGNFTLHCAGIGTRYVKNVSCIIGSEITN